VADADDSVDLFNEGVDVATVDTVPATPG